MIRAKPVPTFADHALADHDWTDERFGHHGFAYWPLEISDPTGFDPASQVMTDDLTNLTPVKTRRVVKAKRGVRDLTPEELAARKPKPATLSKLQFIGLVQSAGGMTDAQLVAGRQDPNLAALWIKFEMAAPDVTIDHPVTQAGLDALEALGYVPGGKQAVLDGWPTA